MISVVVGQSRSLHGQEYPEYRSARQAVEFDDAAVITDDLGDEGKAKTCSTRLGGHKRVEQMAAQILRNAAAIILNRHHQRQMDPGIRARNGEADAMLERRRQRDFAAFRRGSLGSILDEVQKDLDQPVAIAVNRRQ